MRKITMTNTNGQIAIYQTEDGQTHLDVRFEVDSVWLTQRQMSEVFDTTPENILMHLRNIFRDAELDESSTTKDFLVVRTEGNRQVERNLKHLLVPKLRFGNEVPVRETQYFASLRFAFLQGDWIYVP